MRTLNDFNIKTKKPWEIEGVEWREVKLGDKGVAEIIMGQSPPSSSYNKDGEKESLFYKVIKSSEEFIQNMLCLQPIQKRELKRGIFYCLLEPLSEMLTLLIRNTA